MKKYITTIIKYLFSIVFLVLSLNITKDPKYLVMSIIELLIIFLVSDYLVGKSKWFNILNAVIMFLFNIQVCVLYFGNSFITYVMLESLYNIEDLSGKSAAYITGVASVILFSLLPVKSIDVNDKIKVFSVKRVVSLMVAYFLVFCVIAGTYSPFLGYTKLYGEWKDQQEMKMMVKQLAAEAEINEQNTVSVNTIEEKPVVKQSVSTDSVSDQSVSDESASENEVFDEQAYIASLPFDEQMPYLYPEGESVEHTTFGPNVNVILIFTEGLSKNIILDSRHIMPNVNGIMNNSINFENYYNHTFATYRGLQGQLYSGNSLNDQDTNKLISIMDILRVNGYYTEFYNTEPMNQEFTTYLNAMSFDAVLSESENIDGAVNSISDGDAYQRLFDNAMQYNAEGRKFFLAMYTLGTHASFNSVGEVYGDGSNPFLNKFYNADVQFGKFFAQYLNSPLAGNTMIVFTSDHATYGDEDFVNTFPGYYRLNNALDQIPFFIYYKGEKATIDAGGRNSLDMAPTILDLLELERPDNFLGYSLYEPKYKNTIVDTFFWNPGCVIRTGNGKIEMASANEKKYIQAQLATYFSRK